VTTPPVPPVKIPPTGPAIPLLPEVRAAYQDLYNSMQKALDNTMDAATVELLNQWQPQIELVLNQDDEYRLSQDTAVFASLQKQINDVNDGITTLRSQIASIASHFSMAATVIAAIDKLVTTLIPAP